MKQLYKENILIVDDNADNLNVLGKLLEAHGYVVRPARDGESAILAAKAFPPNLILLDICMPEMDGYQVCQEMKLDEKLCKVPIIYLSALNQVEDKMKAFSLGGVDYITKPFQEKEVLARVKTHLEISQLHRHLEEKNQELTREIGENKELIAKLEKALSEIDTLQGLLPICAHCHKVRDGNDYWQQLEDYVQDHCSTQFSHGICPECFEKYYPDIYKKYQDKQKVAKLDENRK